jgi:DNA gyrase/topoisomerase IV subunit A
VVTPEKIKEWMQEVKERPESAPLIIQQIANRLDELTERNEILLEENIALQTGERVKEYERHIAHLEYQLELLKRQFNGELPSVEVLAETDKTTSSTKDETSNILIYNTQGRVFRMVIDPEMFVEGHTLAHLGEDLDPVGEPPRLLILPSSEELLFVFTSGRVSVLPVMNLQQVQVDVQLKAVEERLTWELAQVPDEPRAGEALTCIVPISKMALAEFFVQVSRKGCAKKIGKAMAPSILANHYIGKGVKQPADQTLDILLSNSDERIILVSHEGYLLCLEVGMLSFAIEDAMRIGVSDHLVGAFNAGSGVSLLVMTQIGKTIHRLDDRLQIAGSLKLKGQPLFSKARRDAGTRVVGAAAVSEDDWGVAFHQDGRLTMHSIRNLFGTGTIPVQNELLTFVSFPSSSTPSPKAGE